MVVLVHIAVQRARRDWAEQFGRRLAQCVRQTISEALKVTSRSSLRVVTEQTISLVDDENRWDDSVVAPAVVLWIYLSTKHSDRRKRALFGRIAQLLENEFQIRRQEVVIGIIDVPSNNWFSGCGEFPGFQTLPHQLP
jgi:phenylpyruvate tautomerase PptA (4-oxalocrotonate tautomerase family)